jgi:hypothetical protein
MCWYRATCHCRRARELAETAEREPHEDRRRHMLDLGVSYQLAADQMAPPTTSEQN